MGFWLRSGLSKSMKIPLKLLVKAADIKIIADECLGHMSSDELQQKLNHLKAQRESNAQPVDPRAQLERKKYHALYNRIFPHLQKQDFDFAEVADVTGLKERRIRDALVSRLALDDMVKLVGHNPGSCYVCGSRIRGAYTQEPFCMSCLGAVDTAISSLYPPEQSAKVSPAAHDHAQPGINILDDLLACGAPLMAITGDPLYTPPEVLNVLYQDDDAPDEVDEIAALLQLDKRPAKELPPNADLRHFGFQRTNNSRD